MASNPRELACALVQWGLVYVLFRRYLLYSTPQRLGMSAITALIGLATWQVIALQLGAVRVPEADWLTVLSGFFVVTGLDLGVIAGTLGDPEVRTSLQRKRGHVESLYRLMLELNLGIATGLGWTLLMWQPQFVVGTTWMALVKHWPNDLAVGIGVGMMWHWIALQVITVRISLFRYI